MVLVLHVSEGESKTIHRGSRRGHRSKRREKRRRRERYAAAAFRGSNPIAMHRSIRTITTSITGSPFLSCCTPTPSPQHSFSLCSFSSFYLLPSSFLRLPAGNHDAFHGGISPLPPPPPPASFLTFRRGERGRGGGRTSNYSTSRCTSAMVATITTMTTTTNCARYSSEAVSHASSSILLSTFSSSSSSSPPSNRPAGSGHSLGYRARRRQQGRGFRVGSDCRKATAASTTMTAGTTRRTKR